MARPSYIPDREIQKLYSPHQPGFIYLLESEYGYKIGRTNNIPRRMSQLTIALPFEVWLVHTIPAWNMFSAEKGLHACFMHEHINGEWFDLSGKSLLFITGIEEL